MLIAGVQDWNRWLQDDRLWHAAFCAREMGRDDSLSATLSAVTLEELAENDLPFANWKEVALSGMRVCKSGSTLQYSMGRNTSPLEKECKRLFNELAPSTVHWRALANHADFSKERQHMYLEPRSGPISHHRRQIQKNG